MKWPRATLAQVAPPERSKVTFSEDQIIWHLQLDQIESQTGRILSKVRTRARDVGNSTFTFDERHVLYSKLRPYLNKVVRPDEPGMATSELVPLRPRSDLLDADFLKFYLRSGEFLKFADHTVAGAKMPRMIMDRFWQHTLPLPPPSEQRRIVELVERADDLRRQSSRADAMGEHLGPSLFRAIFGDAVANPKGWPTKPLGQLADFVSGATPSKDRGDYWSGSVPWVSAKDMKSLEITETIDHISKAALRETNIKPISPGAVLIVVRGMILAHTVPIALNRVTLTINQDLKALVPIGPLPAEFLQWALLSQHQNLLGLVSIAAHGTRKLDTEALMTLPIPIPTNSVDKFTELALHQSRAREYRRRAADNIERMFQAILQRAFTGELTASWREAHLPDLLAEMEQQTRLLTQLA